MAMCTLLCLSRTTATPPPSLPCPSEFTLDGSECRNRPYEERKDSTTTFLYHSQSSAASQPAAPLFFFVKALVFPFIIINIIIILGKREQTQ